MLSMCSQIATQAASALPFHRQNDRVCLSAKKQGPDYPGRIERLKTDAFAGMN